MPQTCFGYFDESKKYCCNYCPLRFECVEDSEEWDYSDDDLDY